MKIRVICLISSLIIFSSSAKAIDLCGQPVQGEILTAKAKSTDVIEFNGKKIPLTPEGEFLIALGRDHDLKPIITINGTKHTLGIKKQKWDIQDIKGIPQKKVTPSPEDQQAITRERTDLHKALAPITLTPYWKKGFIQPVEGRISGQFGGQRIMNGIPRNPHQGLDIAAPEGTPVKAAADGIIRLADHDYFYTGNVIVIDHGYNLSTIYAHLKDISVKDGDLVKQGQIIGTLGKTGRVTGPHLHWGASLNDTRFNPQSLLRLNNTDFCFQLP